MVKKTSYLSQPQNVGMGIAIPRKIRLDEKNISAILKAENPCEIYSDEPKEKRYEFSWRPDPNKMYGFDPEEYAREPEKEHCITVAEVLARLEKKRSFVICSQKALFHCGNLTTILCDAVGIMYNEQYGDLFHNLADYLKGSKFAKIYCEKEDFDFSVTLTFANESATEWIFEKTVKANSLMKCFEELDFFFFR